MNDYQNDFPAIENLKSASHSYVYLDNAATTLKPQTVIDAVSCYYTHCAANVYRGNYRESERATILYENTRAKVAQLINAKKHEIIFTRGSTDSINFLIDLLDLTKTDTVINCLHDHHANFIPWNERAQLLTIDLSTEGLMDLQKLEDTLKRNKVKLITITHASNVTGNVQSLNKIIALARQYHALVCVDGAQIIAHRAVDVRMTEVDFYIFSSHKMFGPGGVGVLYIREDILTTLPYKRFGGGMVNRYDPQKKLYKKPPLGFEPGTPPIEAVIGFGKAIDYLLNIGFDAINTHLSSWSRLFLKQLENSSWKLAFPKNCDSLAIFTLVCENPKVDLAWLARLLSDTYNIAVSDGQQCCGPLYFANRLDSGLRISAQIYNPLADAEYFFHCLEKLAFFTR